MKKLKKQRYKNKKFLQALGKHCQKIRISKGYSIDRMYREGDQLSTSTIHRFENGSADTQISAIYRYAQVLEVSLKKIFDFPIPEETAYKILPFSEEEPQPKSSVPYYSIKVAAGAFSDEGPQTTQPEGWVEIPHHRNLSDYFVTRISGNSMLPSIPDGSLCLFRKYRGGSRQNRIFLIKSRGLKDPESDEAYVVKRYKRMTKIDDHDDRDQVVIHLISDNKDYPPIILMASTEELVSTLAEFVEVLE